MSDVAPNHQADQTAVDRLHDRLLSALNDPADHWAEQPMLAAGCLAAVLANVLRHVAVSDPHRLPWISELLGKVADIVADAVKPPGNVPVGTVPLKWH